MSEAQGSLGASAPSCGSPADCQSGDVRAAMQRVAERHFAASNEKKSKEWERRAHAHAWAGAVEVIRTYDTHCSPNKVREGERSEVRATQKTPPEPPQKDNGQ